MYADTSVSVTNCITSGQEILADNPPPATTDVLLTSWGLITLVGDMSRVVSSSNRSRPTKQTANIINEAQCMYSSSNSEVESVDDSDYIPSDCSFTQYAIIMHVQQVTHTARSWGFAYIDVIPTNNDDGRKYDKQTHCYFCTHKNSAKNSMTSSNCTQRRRRSWKTNVYQWDRLGQKESTIIKIEKYGQPRTQLKRREEKGG